MNKKNIILFCLIIICISQSCSDKAEKLTDKEKKALKIGEKTIKEKFGNALYLAKRPYKILSSGKYWIVLSADNDGREGGGGPEITIDTSTYEVVKAVLAK